MDHGPPGHLERLNQGRLHFLVVLHGLSEHGGLFKLEPHVQAHCDHHDGEQERDTPAPHQKGVVQVFAVHSGVERDPAGQQQHEPIGENKADRCTQLGPHGCAGTFAFLRVLAGEQSSTRPFTAQPKALAEAHNRQHCWRPQPDLVVGGEQPNEEGCQTHRQQCAHEGCFTADLIAEMPENNRPERPGDEGNTESGEGGQKLGGGVFRGEKQCREHRDCGGRVNIKIVELDSGAHQGRQNNATAWCSVS